MPMKAIILLFLLVTVLPLGACAPQMVTEYEIVPPASDSGRYCANNCLAMKDSCEQNCWQQQASCEQMNHMERNIDYLSYVAGRSADGKPIKRTPNDFNGSRFCGADACLERCTQNFNVCHTNCGGKVIPHTYCSAFCEP